jgi:hypothetical protein
LLKCATASHGARMLNRAALQILQMWEIVGVGKDLSQQHFIWKSYQRYGFFSRVWLHSLRQKMVKDVFTRKRGIDYVTWLTGNLCTEGNHDQRIER